MNLKKAIILLLILKAVEGIVYEILYFQIPQWIEFPEFLDIFEVSELLTRSLKILAYVFILVGVVKLIKNKKMEIIDVFKYPIMYFFTITIFKFITFAFSSKYSFFYLPEGSPWFAYILWILGLALFVMTFIYFVSNQKQIDTENIKVVSHKSRFINWLIDLMIISILSLYNIKILFQGFVFQDNEFLISNPYWFIAINMFCYYLLLESVFLQTIGKLHNNSFVTYSDQKTKSILIRTISRFIPLNPFSFFGKTGWHDAISNTKVAKLPE
jgi:hypothetical protein